MYPYMYVIVVLCGYVGPLVSTIQIITAVTHDQHNYSYISLDITNSYDDIAMPPNIFYSLLTAPVTIIC